ncbi:MAG: site-specific integrase [Clostridia bacterium]|nr:site-specific integrase [Clostridia bacterium]
MAKRRKSGEGTVRQRKDGRWEGRVVVSYDEKGLPKTKTECVEKLEALKETIGNPTPSKCTLDMSFGDWMDFWYQNYLKISLRPSTQAGYENHIYKHIIPSLGRIPLNKLTQNDLQVFYANLKKNGRVNRTEIYGESLSDRSVRACHGCCRTALDKAVAEKLIRVNPAVGCKLPPKRGKEMQILTQDEMQRLLIQAKEEGFYEMFLLDIATGMRRGELLALQWDDINFETGEVRINKQVQAVNGELIVSQPKTKSSNRTIILPPAMLRMLMEYRKTNQSRWLFPSPVKEDSPRDPTSCRKRLSMILEHAGCKHVRFHDLRHLFSTQAIQYGMDVKTLAATIGHASVETTLNIYSHVTDEMQRNAAQKIDRAFGNRVPTQDEVRKDAGMDTTVIPKPTQPRFEPYKGIRRKPGTGCISQISETTWEGRYSPRVNGKKVTRNVYAGSLEECERKLAEMIREMKMELGRT